LRRLGGDIENSEEKAQILEDELNKVNDNWAIFYNE
jgi:hypothetical protein